MRKLYPVILSCIVVLIIATSCSTGSLAYKHGDYYKACLESIDRLRSNPKSTKSQNVLTSAYPLAQKTALREIDNALLSNTPDKYDELVIQYERLNLLAGEIFRCPKAYELIPQPVQYVAELAKAKQMAAEQAYQTGIKALETGTVEQARLACKYFQDADRYVKGYKDVQDKMVDARYAATLRVIIQKPRVNDDFQYSADFFYNNFLAELHEKSRNRFIRYYSEEEASRENMRNPHQLIVLNFEDYSIGNVRESKDTREISRDSVIVGQVKVEGKMYNSYNTVKARISVFRRDIDSGGKLIVSIIDAQNNKGLQRRDFPGSFTWTTKWANFKGDDRALSDEQKRLCSREPLTPPTDQDMFIEFSKPIYYNAMSYIQSVYSRY
jgi:hypothetical protein